MTSSSSSFEGGAKAAATAFEVVDALGLAQLVKRRGDLGGSIPLRAAQGCGPLFEGNAFGFQITLRQPITLRRNARGVDVEIAAPYGEALAASHSAVLPRLVAKGLFRPDDLLPTEFAADFLKIEVEGTNDVRVRLWTGLLVRPDAGVWLRASATANRRNRYIELDEQFIADDGALVPLILDMKLRPDAPDQVRLEGEVGTVAPVAPGVRIDEVPVAEAPEIVAAHAAFYDDAYFEAKTTGVTRKYRNMKPPADALESDAPARCRVINIGPAAHTVTGSVPRVVFTNVVPFEVRFDGYVIAVQPDSSESLPTNIGNPNEFTILECAQVILQVTESKSTVRFEPLPQDDPKQRRPDISKARELLGWEPKIDLRTGLQLSLDYFRDALHSTRTRRRSVWQPTTAST